MSGLQDLVAVWRLQDNLRFQNYCAVFTILREACVSRLWLRDLVDGVAPAESKRCPPSWRSWVRSGAYSPLRSARQRLPRTRVEQMPQNAVERRVLNRVCGELTPREFEFLAALLIEIMDEWFTQITVTKAVRDGGRDVLAQYRVICTKFFWTRMSKRRNGISRKRWARSRYCA